MTNRISKYLIYALGEIILVVIGILIALSINNWNEDIKNNKKELKYLFNINMEIIGDSLALERGWFRNIEKKIEGLNLGKQYVLGSYFPEDTIQFINDVAFGGINSRASFIGSSGAYKELVSTGNLSLISDDQILKLIVEYYNNKDFLETYIENVRSDFATYTNSLKTYNPRNSEYVNPDEVERILAKMKRDEFLGLINLELTYAYSIDRVLERYKKESNKLSKSIEGFLGKNLGKDQKVVK